MPETSGGHAFASDGGPTYITPGDPFAWADPALWEAQGVPSSSQYITPEVPFWTAPAPWELGATGPEYTTLETPFAWAEPGPAPWGAVGLPSPSMEYTSPAGPAAWSEPAPHCEVQCEPCRMAPVVHREEVHLASRLQSFARGGQARRALASDLAASEGPPTRPPPRLREEDVHTSAARAQQSSELASDLAENSVASDTPTVSLGELWQPTERERSSASARRVDTDTAPGLRPAVAQLTSRLAELELQVEKQGTSPEEKHQLQARLQCVRSALKEMSSQFDARFLEARARNRRALASLPHAQRIRRRDL